MQTPSITFPIALSLVPWLTPQPLDQMVRTLVGNETGDLLLHHRGVWVNRRRAWDTLQLVTPTSELILHTPPGGHYGRVDIAPDDILYEDQWLLVVNKHAGWYVKPTPWDVHGNLEAALKQFLQARDGKAPTLHLTQQLDQGTSGVLLCTKDPMVNATLQVAFERKAIEKWYLALCVGRMPASSWELRTGHGRMRNGQWGIYPLEHVGKLLPNGKKVRIAHTAFHLEQQMEDAAFVWATPYTGRTHQIRLHLAWIGHPLVGDVRYGGPKHFRGQSVSWPALHAARVVFPHPVTGRKLTIEAEIPPHLAKFRSPEDMVV